LHKPGILAFAQARGLAAEDRIQNPRIKSGPIRLAVIDCSTLTCTFVIEPPAVIAVFDPVS
jgi:hypothetical protein